MKCSVQNCNSDTKRTSKDHGLTFHLFPKQMDLRNAWIEALGLSEWQPRDKSTVCSDHFSDDDFYHTKCGMRKVKSGAVPIISQDACDDLDAPATLKACRICLAMDTKLYSITDFKLNERYEQITGFNIGDEDRLPKMLCWECSQRLYSCHRFRCRALLSQRLMLASLDSDRFITVRDVKSIDRHSNGLQSTLTLKLNEENHSDIHIREPDANLKVEICFDDVIDDVTHDATRDVSHGVAHDVTDYVMDEDHAMDDVDALPEEDADITCDVTLEDSRRQPKEEPVAFALADIKQESNIIFFNEFDQYDSDDDKKLSEVTKKDQDNAPKDKLKKKRPKLEKLKKLRKLDKLDKLAKREKLRNVDIIKQLDRQSRIKNNDVVSTTDRFKEANVKRRKTCDTLDETLFTISALTYDEQIDEINKRQETTAYKNAPYKCTICFRGFQIKDRHDAHVVRHSEQCGAFECFICKTRLKTGRALRKHLTAQHTEKFTCKGCPFETRNRGVAREHERWHAGTKYQCPHCASEFDKLTTYMGHIRIKHASDFVCELCGYTFVSKKGIDVHKKKKHRLHDKNITLEGPYCDMCEVRFISEEAHSRHLQLSSRHSSGDDPNRIRNDSQSMNCERSGRTVRRIERRPTVHLKGLAEREQASENGPVSCEQCGIQLRDLRLYAQHFRRMHPDKNRTKYPAMKTPCMCEQCGRIFQSMALLKDHMWVHTGEKRFQCNSCEKSFTQKSNLVFHSRVHNAQRPSYDCPLCGKQFAFFNNRRRHMFIHTGLKPYRCDTCDKCFTTAGELRAHFQHVHLKKPWPKRARARRDWSKPQP